jgi:DNA repair protein RadC
VHLFQSPLDEANYLIANIFTPFTQEEIWVLLVNTQNRITHDTLVYRGTLNRALVRVGELFKRGHPC